MSEYEDDGAAVANIIAVAREAQSAVDAKDNDLRVIHEETYVAADYKKIEKPDYAPATLGVSTLRALADYVKGDPDAAFTAGRKPFVIVNSPTCVSFGFGAFGPYMRRAFIVKAEAPVPQIPYGTGVAVEQFLINLRSLFANNDDVKTLVALLSKIDASNAVKVGDDGMSQSIAVNKGVRGAEGVTMKPTYDLQPFRTFPEVTQPVSPFVVRLHGGDPTRGQLPFVSLHEADFAQWKLAAVASVKEWLKGELPEGTLILG